MERTADQNRLSGTTLLEILIVVTLFAVIVLGSLFVVDSGRNLSSKTLQMTATEDLAQQMLYRLERELANASGAEPQAVLTAGLVPGMTGTLVVDSTVGFPPTGFLVVRRGTPGEERIAYADLDPDRVTFMSLQRAQQCTVEGTHLFQSEVLWSGLAEPLANQTNPSASDYDGIALEATGQVFFRGDGHGFSYRVPVDPTGGTSYVNGNDLFWGAETPGSGPTLDGWLAIYYAPRTTFDEAETGEDLNGDNDSVDVYDVGQLRRVSWNVSDPADRMDIGFGPMAILQERCDWGGDLDADGFDDPMFLWNKDTNELHVRLFVLGRSVKNLPIVRKVESVMFLRNEPEL